MLMVKYEELLEENKKLKAEIAEAHAALYPAGLVNGEGQEITTTLLERAKMAVMIMHSEADHADEVAEERDEYLKKYDDLLINFKDLDKYNDVLYRLYHAARRLRNSGYDGPFIGEVTEELYNCISGVEQYERELVQTRKKESSSN
jgi:hypothetical protein